MSAAHASFVTRTESVAVAREATVIGRPDAVRQRSEESTHAVAASLQSAISAASVPADPAPAFDQPKPGAPVVALTFDDGPWPGQTEQILGLLAERRCPATFFMIGQQVERWPGIVQAVARAGQPIGNHTYSHRRLDTASADVVEWEILHASNLIQEITATRPVWFRPPGGNISQQVYVSAEHAGARAALWTVDPQDWDADMTTDQIIGNVLSTVRPNAIICLHDGGGDQVRTIAALPAIIDGLRAQGYEFVTLDQLPEVRSGW